MPEYGSSQMSRTRKMALDPDQVAGMRGRLGLLPAMMQQREEARQQKLQEERFRKDLEERKKLRKQEAKQAKWTAVTEAAGTILPIAVSETGQNLFKGAWGGAKGLFGGLGGLFGGGKAPTSFSGGFGGWGKSGALSTGGSFFSKGLGLFKGLFGG